jgi:circadian clock protein KaiC
VLLSGTAGTGKSSFAAAFVAAACKRGERCLYLAFEESPAQIVRNMASIGIELVHWVTAGTLRFQAVRSTFYGLEQHLVAIHRLVEQFRPDCLVMDPCTTLAAVGDRTDITSMLTRMIDYLKQARITALFTSLTEGGASLEGTELRISSVMDTWLVLRQGEIAGERVRLLHILKSRGMAHSGAMREFRLTDDGIQLVAPGAPREAPAGDGGTVPLRRGVS